MNDYHKPAFRAATSGVGFPGLLTLLFIALRLTDNIAWSWVWVLSPLWISALLGLFLVVIAGFVFLFAASRPSKLGESTKKD